MLVLGLETSCDETSASVVRGGRQILSNVIVSQGELHGEYGGIVPEIAARSHVEALTPAIGEALLRADATFWDLHGVAATLGPGLIGSLLVGVAEAKAISAALEIPFVGVNHLEAHIYSNLLVDEVQDVDRSQLRLALLLAACVDAAPNAPASISKNSFILSL